MPYPKQIRPLCQYCGQHRVKAARRRFCSMRCRSLAIGPPRLTAAGRERQQAGMREGHRAQRRKYFARVEAFCRAELAPFADRVPLAELLPVAARIYSKAYDLGYHCTYNRFKKQSPRARVA